MRIEKILSTLVLLAAIYIFARFAVDSFRSNDTVGPNIEMDSSQIELSVKDLQVKLLRGMTATDARDGDVTDTLVIESISDFVGKNTRTVTYAAFDKDNNVTKATRSLIYTDYEPARFSLSGPLRFPVSTNQQNILGMISVTDSIDGDISDKVNFSSSSVINIDTAGDYKVIMEVTNSAGDTFSLPLTITIYDTSAYNAAPKIQLSSYLVYTKVGQAVDPMEYIDGMTYRGTDYRITEGEGTFRVDTSDMEREELEEFKSRNPAVSTSLFEIIDMTNYNYPGVYEIQYTLGDGEGNYGRVILTVVVEE